MFQQASEPNATCPSITNISDVDYRLIGLSPQYWTNTPLLIGDLIAMPLINGVDCFITPQRCHDTCKTTVPQPSTSTSWHILPLSRVLLRGLVTAIDRRSNGCTLIVLDDGTGSIDCLHWDNNGSNYNLPFLLPEHEKSNSRKCSRFFIGDFLEVMGKIRTLTAGIPVDSSLGVKTFGSSLEVRLGCVREVHVSSVHVIGMGPTRFSNHWNGEVVHWLECMTLNQRMGSHIDDVVKNGKDVLPLLGETMTAAILGTRSDYDFFQGRVEDDIIQRKCCQTSQRFRKAFLYCYCEATFEALDSGFHYRDALLHFLLDSEETLHHPSQSNYEIDTEDCMDLLGAQHDSMSPPFLVTFESVFKEEKLTLIARDIVSSTSLPEANAQRLIQKTFAALANDGILSLYDSRRDLYLLVSSKRVLEPYLRNLTETGPMPPPFFIKSVPRRRMIRVSKLFKIV